MVMERKKPEADLRKYYTVIMEAGLVLALLISIAAVKVKLPTEEPEPVVLE